MKAVVTGGAGFIGSHIVDALVSDGYEVLVLDDFSSGLEKNLQGAEKSGRLELLERDICDPQILSDVESFGPEVVFHLAAQINVRRSVSEPVFDAEKNVAGTVNILEAARIAGAKQFIFSSTGGAIYGEQEEFPARETHPAGAESPYGVGKRAAELYLDYYARTFGLNTTSLRYSNVYGPRQNPKGEAGVVAIFTERVFAQQSLRVNGDGKQTRDFIFVKDVVSANMSVCRSQSAKGFEIYNVGRGVEVTVLDIVSIFQKLVEEEQILESGKLLIEHGPALPGEQRRSVIDSSKLKDALSWNCRVELEDGIRQTIESFKVARVS